jgi:hypothetical protein
MGCQTLLGAHAHPTWADFTATTWIVVVLFGIAAGWSIWKAVLYTVHPGEEEPDHIKRLILGDPDPLQVSLVASGGPKVTDRGTSDSGPSDSGPSDSGKRGDAPKERRPAGDDGAEQTHAR